MIEKFQKQVLFNEAAKIGIVSNRLREVPEIYADLLGLSDIGQQLYGAPLAPVYKAKDDVDVSRIAKYFKGISRDINVSNLCLSELEDKLVSMSLEVWARATLIKNKSVTLIKKSKAEKSRVSLGATWIFTETLSNTNNIDMQNTTAWIDTSEGVASLPTPATDETVHPKNISVVDQTTPSGGSFLGSNPYQAFDGLVTTNWRCIFVKDEFAIAEIQLKDTLALTGITIDPVGYGTDLKIEGQENGAWKEIVRVVQYQKRTYPIKITTNKLRISFKPTEKTLPKTTGLREVIIYTSISVNEAELVSKRLKPSDGYTEIKLNYTGTIPNGGYIQGYYRSSESNPWIKVQNDSWTPITKSSNSSLAIDIENSTTGTVDESFRGLYGIPVNSAYQMPLSTYEGTLEVGLNQLEISAFRKDWLEEGILPKLLSPTDFKNNTILKTWSNVPEKSYAASGLVIQYSNQSFLSADPTVNRGGNVFAFQYKPSLAFPEAYRQFNSMVIVPFSGSPSGICQDQYSYRLRFNVYCPKAFSYSDAKFWFFQGYRKASRRSFKEAGKSYGSFTVYINDVLVTGSNLPNTIFDDNTTDSDLPTNFSMNFNSGWNKVEILITTVNPETYGEDSYVVADKPYLQLSLYPSLFDSRFTSNQATYISSIFGSGTFKPLSEFDLLWNTAKDPTFWAWSQNRKFILFNTNSRSVIDGYFKGVNPTSQVVFKSVTAETINDIYVKYEITKDLFAESNVLLDSYTVMTK